MKKESICLMLFLWIVCCLSVKAEVPQGFSFQAVVRDNQGELATNRIVNIRISLLEGGESGMVLYAENHSVRTNSQGLVSLVIGNGSNQSGELSSIEWGDGVYFLKMEADANGGVDYQLVAVTQLLSVPYALHAQSAEKITGSVMYEQIIGVPDNIGFSGSWNDLTDKPDLFSGSWNDLTDVPDNIGFDGVYDHLIGKPSIADSIMKYGFPGTWDALDGKPYLFDGNYSSLNGKPNIRDSVLTFGFSGNWEDLRNRPNFSRDSVGVWNALLDYNQLQNKPLLSEDGKFTGKYEDLSGKPDIPAIARDEIKQTLDTLRYASLKGLPSIKDTVLEYGFSGKYEDLENLPNMEELVITEYSQLRGLPNLKDTVLKYAPEGGTIVGSSSWNDLKDKPVLKDTVEKYGFSGNYNDLKDRPQGNRDGDILYWSNGNWTILPIGEEGQMLTVAGGKLSWIDPSFASTAANTYKVGEIYEVDGQPQGIVVEVSSVGRYAKIASLTEYQAKWAAFDSADDMVNATSSTDGMANTALVKSIVGYETQYPAFGVYNELGDGWYLPAVDEIKQLYASKDRINASVHDRSDVAPVNSALYWTSTESGAGYANAYLFKDSTFVVENEGNIALIAGTVFESTKDDIFAVRPFKRISWSEVTSKPETSRLWRVGDIYINPQTSQPEGIVYKISDGGLHGMIVSYKEMVCNWDECNSMVMDNLGEGWTVPSAEDMLEILTQQFIINASIDNYLQGGNANKITDINYWVEDDCQIDTEPGGGIVYYDDSFVIQTDCASVDDSNGLRAIKAF